MTKYRVAVTEADRLRADLAVQLVAVASAVTPQAMTAGDRLPAPARRARWLAIYLGHVAFGWPLERVAHAFGVSRATASAGCQWVEDARDDRALDRLLEQLEALVRLIADQPRLELMTLPGLTGPAEARA